MEVNASSDDSKDERVKELVVAVIVVSIGLLLFYIYSFKSGKLSSDSSDWANLGSYFSGLISPVIGFITILLLFKTYKSQKDELRAARLLLDAQVSQSASKAMRDMLWKSAENVYCEIVEKWIPEYQADIKTKVLLEQHDKFYSIAKVLREDYLHLLLELSSYLNAIDELTGDDKRSTDFYRRRISGKFEFARQTCEKTNRVLTLFEPLIEFRYGNFSDI